MRLVLDRPCSVGFPPVPARWSGSGRRWTGCSDFSRSRIWTAKDLAGTLLAMAGTPIVLSIVVLLGSACPCLAASQPAIPEDVQQEAMTCVSEAMKICPDLWTAEDHGLACMTGQRASFSPRCRVIYDKVDHALNPPSKLVSKHDRARSNEVR